MGEGRSRSRVFGPLLASCLLFSGKKQNVIQNSDREKQSFVSFLFGPEYLLGIVLGNFVNWLNRLGDTGRRES